MGVEENKKQSIVLAGLFSYWAEVGCGMSWCCQRSTCWYGEHDRVPSLSLDHMLWSRAHSGNDVEGSVPTPDEPPPTPQPRIMWRIILDPLQP